MHVGLSQMEARSLRVKLHQKLTPRSSVLLGTKRPGGKGKITSLLTVLFEKRGLKEEKTSNKRFG